ncbi:MAG: hypothetical protein OXG64_03585 [Chloroflexi bacterium]|nr:hypothetical protein [Chloroflexota bacterium]
MRVLRFVGRILKRAWADIVKASNTSANTRANKIDKLTGGMGDQINMGSS